MNEHSAKFILVQNYFSQGLWNKKMVVDAIGRWITEDEATEIIGTDADE